MHVNVVSGNIKIFHSIYFSGIKFKGIFNSNVANIKTKKKNFEKLSLSIAKLLRAIRSHKKSDHNNKFSFIFTRNYKLFILFCQTHTRVSEIIAAQREVEPSELLHLFNYLRQKKATTDKNN